MHLDYVNQNPIPQLMKNTPQWLNWKPGEPDENGKFSKYPIDLNHWHKVDAHAPENQSTFQYVYKRSQNFENIGIGFVLNGKPITSTNQGEAYYLIGIDIDPKANLSCDEVKKLWLKLKKTYVEISPSKRGFRMFCLSKELIPNRNSNGLEIYTSKRFLTITGWSGQGDLIDCTSEIKALHAEWFPTKTIKATNKGSNDQYPPPDTPRNRAWVEELLSYVDPDCDYETYRNMIWAIEAIDWHDIEDIERKWSLGAPDRFSEDCLTILRSSFDNRRDGITFGSLVHYAKVGGWNPNTGLKRGGE